jgi:hypothetical protein
MATTHLGLPQLAADQAQKHVTVNEALLLVDALVFLALLDRNLASPPSSPAEGARYLVAASPSGAWAGHAGHIAVFQDSGWTFLVPRAGWRAVVLDEGAEILFDGTRWRPIVGLASGAATSVRVVDEEVTLTGASVDTSVVIPNRAVVIGVSTRTTQSITGASSYDCGTASEPSKFGGSLGIVAGSTNAGVIGPTAFYSDTPVRLKANGANFTGGKVRVAIHYLFCDVPEV